MAEVDPETLLEWLSMGQGDERDMQVSSPSCDPSLGSVADSLLFQLIALEQLCMVLLMSDHVDRCFDM